MSSETKRSPKLLKRLLVQPVSSETHQRGGNASKRPRQPTVDEHSAESIKRRKKNKDFIDSVVKAVSTDKYLSDRLNHVVCQSNSDPDNCLLVVTTKILYFHEPAKYVSRLQLVLSSDGSYYIQVLLSTVEEGNVATPEDFKELCEKIADSKNFKFCPGIEPKEYEQCKKVIGYDPKSVRIIDVPVKRIASEKCEPWFRLGKHGITKDKKLASEVLCPGCRRLQHYLLSSMQRLSSVTPEDIVRREQADSSFPMKYLSPESLQRRQMNIKAAKAKEKRKIKKHCASEEIHTNVCFPLPPVEPVENKYLENSLPKTTPPLN